MIQDVCSIRGYATIMIIMDADEILATNAMVTSRGRDPCILFLPDNRSRGNEV